MQEYSNEDFYLDVKQFNELCGKGKPKNKQDLLNQIKLIREELDETEAAVNAEDPVETLDGVIDVGFTFFGLMGMLEALSFDVMDAAATTCDNNLTKFVSMPGLVDATIDMVRQKEPGKELTVEYSSKYRLYAVKDSNGKVLKPYGYKRNNVALFAPSAAFTKLSEG